MVETGVENGYKSLAAAVLYKAVLYKAVLESTGKDRDDVLLFMRGKYFHLYCDIAGVKEKDIKGKIITPKTKPKPVDVYRNNARVLHADSISQASRFTGDPINRIRRSLITTATSVNGYAYRSCLTSAQS